MSHSQNLHVLTRSHNLIATKKARRRDQIKEVLFDDNARREFLTGFHKRKLAKAEAARSKAKERQKQERLEARREQRQSLREQGLQNAAQVEKAYGAHIDEDEPEVLDEEWTGINHDPNGEHADEYEDEEQLATVTVIEDFDPDSLIHGPPNPVPSSSNPRSTIPPSTSRPSRPAVKSTPPPKNSTSTKIRPKKIRYETKDARRRERTKQHARRAEKAELAGGKASRKSNSRSKSKRHNSKR